MHCAGVTGLRLWCFWRFLIVNNLAKAPPNQRKPACSFVNIVRATFLQIQLELYHGRGEDVLDATSNCSMANFRKVAGAWLASPLCSVVGVEKPRRFLRLKPEMNPKEVN
jgi:hypothetical protein